MSKYVDAIAVGLVYWVPEGSGKVKIANPGEPLRLPEETAKKLLDRVPAPIRLTDKKEAVVAAAVAPEPKKDAPKPTKGKKGGKSEAKGEEETGIGSGEGD